MSLTCNDSVFLAVAQVALTSEGGVCPRSKSVNQVTVICHCVLISGDLSHAELMMMTIADIIKQLIEAHEQGKDVNLNK